MLAAGIPRRAAISPMGLRVAFCAISMSELTISPVVSRRTAALIESMRAAGSDRQHDFPDVIRRLHEAVCFAGFGQRKGAVNDGPHAARGEQRPDVFADRLG